MEFKNPKLELRFVVPDVISVRKQLAFTSVAASRREQDLLENLWRASQLVITEWECPHVPDVSVDLEAITDPRAGDAITWAALEVRNYMQRLDDIPKN
jgi:hypothetical protein